MAWQRFLIPAIACVFLVACSSKKVAHAVAPPAFWVWHRSSALTPPERAALKSTGTGRLFWQVAECEWKGGRWDFVKIADPAAVGGETPVFRIKPDAGFLAASDSPESFAKLVRAWADSSSLPAELQLDFDCPERLLGEYADFIEQLRQNLGTTRISITALASWPGNPQFKRLAKSVSSLSPMFYDLESDAPDAVRRSLFQPMASPGALTWMEKWADCPTPWLAGLPNFERVSIFEANGRLVGHLRGWEPDAVFFHPSLTPEPLKEGITLFNVQAPCTFGESSLTAGQKVVHRIPDPEILRALNDAAVKYGAAGVIYFTLPGPGIQAAYTPAHLLSGSRQPQLVLSVDKNGGVTLRNTGTKDLPDQRWTLELKATEVGAFRSGGVGEFPQIQAMEGIPAETGTTLHLQFSRLRIGESITSGAVLQKTDGIVWSVKGVTSEAPVNSP